MEFKIDFRVRSVEQTNLVRLFTNIVKRIFVCVRVMVPVDMCVPKSNHLSVAIREAVSK